MYCKGQEAGWDPGNETKHSWNLYSPSLLDSASKHALQGYFDSLRAELGPRGVTVTVVSPGYIATQLSANAVQGDGSKHGGVCVCVIIHELSLGKQLVGNT